MKRVSPLAVCGVLFSVLALAATARWSYFLAQRRHWDAEVAELCVRDGGVRVFERVSLTDERYIDREGNIRIPPMMRQSSTTRPLPFSAKPSDLYFEKSSITILNDKDPRV